MTTLDVVATEQQAQYTLGYRPGQLRMLFLYLEKAQGGGTSPLYSYPSRGVPRENHQRSFCDNAFNACGFCNTVIGDFPYLEGMPRNLRAQLVQPCLNICNSVKLCCEAVNVSMIEDGHFDYSGLQHKTIANLRRAQGGIL